MPKVEKRKRLVLTLKQKLDICRRLEKGENRILIMQDFGIGSSTIYDIKAQAKQLCAFVKVTDTPKAAEHRHTLQQKRVVTLDKVLYEWFCLKRSEGAAISGPMLQEKAKEFAMKMSIGESCTFSDDWLHRFKNRHGIRRLDVSGEAKSADLPSAEEFIDRFAKLVSEHDLTPEQIYNADETEEEGDEDFEGFGAVRHTPVVSELIQMSGAAKLNVSDKTLQKWVDVNMKGSVTLSLTDDEIIQSVLDEQQSKLTEADSEEDDDPEPRVSWQDAMKGLSVFIKFAEQCTYMNTHEVISLHCIQNEFLLQRGKNCRQRDIREYYEVRETKRSLSAAEPKHGHSEF
ncbi:hypothetical protein Pmani_030800 [Petrolisthes manimaculis]|uniref:HTH CENPB-type domain-containing protein n=1 Tax=Petrolisthes manimaculis TaxID=1843537 RepID=A0AAE1NX16_9EUCA|nr:hypothetical protein Pmani_030800 [Petrolisthes manimaculis]